MTPAKLENTPDLGANNTGAKNKQRQVASPSYMVAANRNYTY
jgi:hypothetical protein